MREGIGDLMQETWHGSHRSSGRRKRARWRSNRKTTEENVTELKKDLILQIKWIHSSPTKTNT